MNKKQFSVKALLQLVSFYSLFIGIIGVILLLGFGLSKQQTRPSPTPTITPSITISSSPRPEADQPLAETPTPEGKFCGGIAAIQCQNGYVCQLDGTYPDAGGTCVKK